MLSKLKKFKDLNKEIILILFFTLTIIIIIKSTFFFSIISSIVFAYFLNKIENLLKNFGYSGKISFILTYLFLISLLILILLIMIPLISKKSFIFFNDIPFILHRAKFSIYKLIKEYPLIFPSESTNILFSNIISYMQSIGKTVISASLVSIAILIKLILYIFLSPILIFFFLKDHEKIKGWIKKNMPTKAVFWEKVWKLTHIQLDNYIRGKFIEMVVIIIINYALFKFYKINYADVIAIMVGISVFIPYIGIIIVSVPIILITAIQYGLSNDFIYVNLIYAMIHILDGNVLVPILFSEAVELHPLIIIISIIVFGSLSIYGMVFAIPLAIMTKAIITLHFTDELLQK